MQLIRPALRRITSGFVLNGGVVALTFDTWTEFDSFTLPQVFFNDLVFFQASIRATLNALSTLLQLRISQTGGSAAFEPNSANFFGGVTQERFPAGVPASVQTLSGMLLCVSAGNATLSFAAFPNVGDGSVAINDFQATFLHARP